ncbi:hypothetical protein V6N11_064313 [Hibiscus sabdariffa]|uniref:RNase H type-1 domain-containing protein n=1 Tax=Hibiscus sabdariffa TaxID=183260 RepID=A0ABR2PN84_9ROSI
MIKEWVKVIRQGEGETLADLEGKIARLEATALSNATQLNLWTEIIELKNELWNIVTDEQEQDTNPSPGGVTTSEPTDQDPPAVLDFTREPQACSVQDRSSKRPAGIFWEAPIEGAVKFNVDAAVNGVVGPAGIGGVLKDHTGKTLLCFSKYIGFSDPMSVELQGILEACCCFVGSQWVGTKSLIIESDSEIAVNWIKRPFSVPANFKDLVGKCKEYIDRYKVVGEARLQQIVEKCIVIGQSVGNGLLVFEGEKIKIWV